MTAGNDGTPENDDPFGYLYKSENGEQPPDPAAGQQPGMPRTSHHQVTRVGERRPQPPQAPSGYGYPQQQQAPPAYGYPQGQPGQQGGQGQPGQQGYGTQQPYGGSDATQAFAQQPPSSRRAGGGHQGDAPNRKGLLIAAVAVVAVVAIGIAFAMTNGPGSDDDKADGKPTAAPTTSAPPTTETKPPAAEKPFSSDKVDAATLTLGGGAETSDQWSGADASDGTYVDHMNVVGASATWTVTVPKSGAYTFFITYGNAGPDANLSLAVNAKPRTDAVNLRNYGDHKEWDKAWGNHTFSWVDLNKGSNTLQLSCQPANEQCGVNLDQVWLKQGQVKN